MQKSQRLSKSESARDRRAKVREIVELKISNLYSRLHKLRLKKQKIKTAN
jgi:ABC-type phosphate transport system auxiliary subunit